MTRSLLLPFVLLSFAAFAAPPAAGSVEESVRESLRLLRDGKVDQFISDWCDPAKCTENNMADLREFSIARAQHDAAACLKAPDDSITVSKIKGDPAKDESITVYIECEGRMPVPSTSKKVDGKWKLTSWSW